MRVVLCDHTPNQARSRRGAGEREAPSPATCASLRWPWAPLWAWSWPCSGGAPCGCFSGGAEQRSGADSNSHPWKFREVPGDGRPADLLRAALRRPRALGKSVDAGFLCSVPGPGHDYYLPVPEHEEILRRRREAGIPVQSSTEDPFTS